MEVIAPLTELMVSFTVIAALVLMTMIFGVTLAQLMYGLFEG
jgi:hypothetical protein